MSRKPRKFLIALALLGLSVRLAVPAGYMPAALGDGGPIKLCPGGLRHAALQVLEPRPGAHDGHESDDRPGVEDEGHAGGWAHCPEGAVFASAALTSEIDLAIAGSEAGFGLREPAVQIGLARVAAYRARAPPAL